MRRQNRLIQGCDRKIREKTMTKDPKEFCTCTATDCPNHPVNHDQGCSLCILKNLTRKEIPGCFFNTIDHEKPTKDWYYEDFAALVEAAKKDGKL